MERVQCLAASAIAYSATAVLPALVCAATKTLLPYKSTNTIDRCGIVPFVHLFSCLATSIVVSVLVGALPLG